MELLLRLFPNFVDRSLRLHSYWSRLEHSLANDIAAARGVWENLIKSSGWMLEAWNGYISMEVGLGNLAEARTLYRRCYTRKFEGNGAEVLCNSWLRFEREYGSLEDYDRAYLKVVPRFAELKKLQHQQDTKLSAAFSHGLLGADDKMVKQASASGLSERKRQIQDVESNKEKKPRKRQKIAKHDTAVIMKETETNTKEGEINDSDIGQSTDRKTIVDTKDKQWFEDQLTVFVAGLAPEVNEEDLYALFSQCNFLKEVRLMKDRKTGVSRRFAYVDFENEDGLAAALKLHNRKLKGSKIRVLRSDPTLSRNKGFHSLHDDKKRDQKLDTEAPKQAMGKHYRGVEGERGRGGRSTTALHSHRRGGHLQLTGTNKFAVPRSLVRPLGFTKGEQIDDSDKHEPKSNEDFRKMLSKKE